MIMKYEVYIDVSFNIDLLVKALNTIRVRLKIDDPLYGIQFDWDNHKFIVRTPYGLERVEEELEDIYIITKIVKVD
jgi:hypothetical protein